MISCAEAVEQLWEYLEQEVPADRRADIDEHLAFCRQCCGELEFAEELRRFLADAARPELPPDVEGRLTSFLDGLDDEDASPEAELS